MARRNCHSRLPSLGQLLHAAGYHTAYFGKWHLGAAGQPASNPLAYGFDHFTPPPGHAEQEGEGDLAAAAAAYLAAYAGTRPLLLVASFNDPHGVYALRKIERPLDTEGIALPASFDDDLATKPAAQRTYRDEDQPAALPLDEATARRYLAWYACMIERADGYLARLLAALDGRPDFTDNTVVIFASDHGDLACAHRLPFKGPCMYEELVRVPLLVQGPGVARGAVRSELVTLADLLPTICDLTHRPRRPDLDGQSLSPLLHGATPPWRDAVIGEYHGKQRWFCPIRMVRTATHKFTLDTTGERELYDLLADPAERYNRAGDPRYAALERELVERLAAWMDGPAQWAAARAGLGAGRDNDRTLPLAASALPAGGLRLSDLGFFDLGLFRTVADRGGYWLSRLQANTAVYAQDGTRLDVVALLRGSLVGQLDHPVLLGSEAALPARLLAVRVPQEVADQRRRQTAGDSRQARPRGERDPPGAGRLDDPGHECPPGAAHPRGGAGAGAGALAN